MLISPNNKEKKSCKMMNSFRVYFRLTYVIEVVLHTNYLLVTLEEISETFAQTALHSVLQCPLGHWQTRAVSLREFIHQLQGRLEKTEFINYLRLIAI